MTYTYTLCIHLWCVCVVTLVRVCQCVRDIDRWSQPSWSTVTEIWSFVGNTFKTCLCVLFVCVFVCVCVLFPAKMWAKKTQSIGLFAIQAPLGLSYSCCLVSILPLPLCLPLAQLITLFLTHIPSLFTHLSSTLFSHLFLCLEVTPTPVPSLPSLCVMPASSTCAA